MQRIQKIKLKNSFKKDSKIYKNLFYLGAYDLPNY